jgi:uncharacterized membrane protein
MSRPAHAAPTPKPRSTPKDAARHEEPRADSVADITARNVKSIQRIESAEQRKRTHLDRIADWICERAGSPPFLIAHVLWFGAWIAYNSWPGLDAFDPFPFTFLTLVVSLEAIFLSTFILISQTRAARISEHRNQLDLQINLLTEQENTKMLGLLESIAEKLGIDKHNDVRLRALEQPTRLENLAQQIESAKHKTRGTS